MRPFEGTCCHVLIGVCLSVPCIVLLQVWQLGQFETLTSLNNEYCMRHKLDAPCEDVALLSDGSVLLACDHTEEYMRYAHVYSSDEFRARITAVSDKTWGKLLRLNPDGQLDPHRDMLPVSYRTGRFHPHGIAVLPGKCNHTNPSQICDWLYVVNHLEKFDVMSIFRAVFATNNNTVSDFVHHLDVTHGDWRILNDVAIIPNSNGAFYTTNWARRDPGNILGFFDILSKNTWSHVLACGSTQNLWDRLPQSQDPISCKVVATGLVGANGIAITPDGIKVFVVEPQHHKIHVYTRKSINNRLIKSHEVDTKFPCDNINIDPDTHDVYVACYPKPFGFLWASWTYPTGRTGSLLYKLAAKSMRPHRLLTPVLQTTGELISGASGCVGHKKRLVAAGLLDSGVIFCKDVPQM